MSFVDQFELEVTAADSAAVDGYSAYVREYLSYGPNLRQLFEIAEASPGAALINAHAAALHLAFEARDGWLAAQPYLTRMKAARSTANTRERLFCDAVAAWEQCDYRSALKALDELTVRWPADICALKWGQYHAFNLGDIDAMVRLGERTRVAHEKSPYAHGMIAFALEQANRLEEAEDEGIRAVEIAIDDAWAHHAIAHVYETQGRAKDGIRWLEHCSHTWTQKGTFIREHNWWHAALFRLSLHQYDKALEIFDTKLWGEWPEFPQEQIGAISLLWRLELRGADVGDRWSPIVEKVRERADDHLFAFHDMHYVFALARAGSPEETTQFIETIAARHNNPVWRDVATPVAKAISDYAQGNKRSAADTLSPVMDKLIQIGGSHAQRHVFVETLEHCQRHARSASAR